MARGNYKHGYFGTITYRSWCEMKRRCDVPVKVNRHLYFDRGITYCKKWADFKNFLADMGERPVGTSIDRIDNNKGYFKRNCRWATRKEQSRNTRFNRLFNGKTLSEWSEILGINRSTLATRYYQYHWSVEKILSVK